MLTKYCSILLWTIIFNCIPMHEQASVGALNLYLFTCNGDKSHLVKVLVMLLTYRFAVGTTLRILGAMLTSLWLTSHKVALSCNSSLVFSEEGTWYSPQSHLLNEESIIYIYFRICGVVETYCITKTLDICIVSQYIAFYVKIWTIYNIII